MLNQYMNGREEKQKIVSMVVYLFGLAYDLALNTRKNVSSSPGFEVFGLVKVKIVS